MSDELFSTAGAAFPAHEAQAFSGHNGLYAPISGFPQTEETMRTYSKEKITVITHEYALDGFIHIPEDEDEDRRLSDHLNDLDRRFLALTQVAMEPRKGVHTPRKYPFMQVNMKAIHLIHPVLQLTGAALLGLQGASSGHKATTFRHEGASGTGAAEGDVQQAAHQFVPLEVQALTPDWNIQGWVYVKHRAVQGNNRLSTILNQADRQFLALTNVRLSPREDFSAEGEGQSASKTLGKSYGFLLLNLDAVEFLNPLENDNYDVSQLQQRSDKFNHLRQKFL